MVLQFFAKTTTSSLIANFGGKVRVGTGTFAIFRPNVAAYEGSKNTTCVRRDIGGKSMRNRFSKKGEISDFADLASKSALSSTFGQNWVKNYLILVLKLACVDQFWVPKVPL